MSVCTLIGCNKDAYCKGLCKAHYNKEWRYGDTRHNGRLSRRKVITFEIKKETGCFECTSHYANENNYAEYHFNNRKTAVHRYIYEECFGLIPEGMIIRHKCDNRLCINPEHLEIGTHLENMKDMRERGRQCKGSQSPFSKLTESDVVVIKRMLKNGMTCAEIACKYNVSRTTISYIKNGRNWTHVS